jgi:hypothetical protein
MGNDYNCPPMCPRCNKLHYTNQICERKALGPSDATACSPFVVLNLKRLKLIPCADKDATQDTIRALRSNGVQYVALRWHAAAESYVQLEAHE